MQQPGAKIVDMHGRPISSGGANRYLAKLSNGAASLTDPSLLSWDWHGGSPDDDLVKYLSIVRQRCRDLAINAPVVAGVINTLVVNTVGIGLIPEPTPDAEFLGMDQETAAAWKKRVLRAWDKFAESKDCDICGVNNFYELTQLAFRSELESGDVFATLPYDKRKGSALLDLKIQLIEADCVCDPLRQLQKEIVGDVYGGVEIDQHGQVLAYWVATRHPQAKRYPFLVNGSHVLQREWVRVPVYGDETGRRNILHLMRAMRPGQRRGVPILAPIVKATKQLDRYFSAELQAALIQALFTMAVYSENPESTVGEFNAAQAAKAFDDQDAGNDGYTASQRFYEQNGMVELGSGNVAFLAPNDKVEAISATRPVNGFAPFVEAQLKAIGVAVGLPYEMVMMHFTASYSASRAAVNMATSGFKVWRDHLTYDFCQPVFEAFMTEAVAAGYIEAPGFFSDPLKRYAYCRAKWNGPGTLQIDPGKDIDAAIKKVSVGVSTLQQETAEINGGTWLDNALARHEEQRFFESHPWDPTMAKVGTSESNVTDEGDEDDKA